MKKKILNLSNILSYLLFLVFLCVLYGTSTVTKENTLLFNDNIMLTCWVLFFLLVLLSLINLIFHLIEYFRKRKTEITGKYNRKALADGWIEQARRRKE